jgi:AcrR family transcriptional regulator
MTASEAQPVSRRSRPAKAPLTREVIVETGLAVLDRDGMDALTMRRVAQELDTGAASLYVYVTNRDDLLAAMLDHALAGVSPRPSRRGSWQFRLTALLTATVDAMARHEGLAVVALGTLPTGLNALLIFERMIGLLREAGLDDATVSWAADLLYLHAVAVAAEQSVYNAKAALGQTEAGVLRSAAEQYAALPADRYPLITSMGERLLAGSGDQRARWALNVLLNGILHTPAG